MKDNKLLLENLEVYQIDTFENVTFVKFSKESLWQVWEPNSNWNQLMMVVEKIRQERNQPENLAKLNDPDFYYDLHDILAMLCASYIGKCDYNITDIHNACVEYIKQDTLEK